MSRATVCMYISRYKLQHAAMVAPNALGPPQAPHTAAETPPPRVANMARKFYGLKTLYTLLSFPFGGAECVSAGTLRLTAAFSSYRIGGVMGLDLEVAGAVRELSEMEVLETPAAPAQRLKRLRDTHHAAARGLARGLGVNEVSLQTGYTSARLYGLMADPSFKELVAHYAKDSREAGLDVEARFLGVALDTAQVFHERILDDPDSVTPALVLEAFKVFADRAGYAPISRSINKNVNLNLGERLDAAKRKKDEAA